MSDILSTLTTEQLRTELANRERAAQEAHWQRMKAEAKYFCPYCGGPDSWHARDCPSDALDTCT